MHINTLEGYAELEYAVEAFCNISMSEVASSTLSIMIFKEKDLEARKIHGESVVQIISFLGNNAYHEIVLFFLNLGGTINFLKKEKDLTTRLIDINTVMLWNFFSIKMVDGIGGENTEGKRGEKGRYFFMSIASIDFVFQIFLTTVLSLQERHLHSSCMRSGC